jgi:DNA-binding NtrC family response regulator
VAHVWPLGAKTVEKIPHILLVDDDCNSRTTLAGLLSQVGYAVSTAVNDQETWQCLQTDTYDLLLLDICLMNMKGVALLQNLRQTYPHMDVLVLTACADLRVAQETIGYGVTDYLIKPIDPQVIVQCLADALTPRSQNNVSISSTLYSEKRDSPFCYDGRNKA